MKCRFCKSTKLEHLRNNVTEKEKRVFGAIKYGTVWLIEEQYYFCKDCGKVSWFKVEK